MSESRHSVSRSTVAAPANAAKRVILSMGGKGGVGKTGVMAGLAEWFDANQIPVKLLDLDTENKARGSLTHFRHHTVRRGCVDGQFRGNPEQLA